MEEAYSNISNDVIHKMNNLIQTKPISRPHIINMLYTNVTVDDGSQYFTTPIKQNQNPTVPIYQVLLGSDPMKDHHNITTHTTLMKLPLYGKEYIYIFQTDGRTSQGNTV